MMKTCKPHLEHLICNMLHDLVRRVISSTMVTAVTYEIFMGHFFIVFIAINKNSLSAGTEQIM